VRNGRLTDVFVDVCTQRDYLASDGAHPSLNAGTVRMNLKRLMALARWAKVPTLSCVDVKRPQDVRGLSRSECVVGTPGQRKLKISLLPSRVLIDSDNCLCVSLDILQRHQQAILAKCHRDPFTNPKFDRLLTELPTQRFFVFGVSLETSIRLLTLGLMLRHRQVTLVSDACGWWDAEEGEMTLRQLAAKGCDLMTTHEVIESVLTQYRPARTANLSRHRSVA
jgi:nicotinamidase-related amidase